MIANHSARAFSIFVPGKLRNNANHGGSWRARASYQKRWREKTQAMALAVRTLGFDGPKQVTLDAGVWNLFDAHDGLPNALKPVVDGLVRAGLLDSDAPAAGHTFVYRQVIDRQYPGVLVRIEPGEGG